MKSISILGSTGSIGENTLRIVRHLGPEKVRVAALAAKGNIDLLEKQALEFSPDVIAVYDDQKAAYLQRRLPGIPVLGGIDGIKAAASWNNSNFVVSAMSGTAGLVPTIEAIKAGKNVGLANKEALVSGGNIIIPLSKEKGVELIPIDSEHSAIFQCIQGENLRKISRLILTASGGPFRTMSKEELAEVTLEKALRHPTWSMGPKVTVDSSTLMNKGLEVIEAYWLFGIPLDRIEVVVHPQSIVHSMVEFQDGSLLAQMSEPSMTIPIQYAITYPERNPGIMEPFDFTRSINLQFYPADPDRFRCLGLAYEAVKIGKSLPCYMNAANEVLVQRFIEKQISWNAIGEKLESLMNSHQPHSISSLEDVILVDTEGRKEAEKY